MIIVLFANLIKLLPGFETVGLLEESAHGYQIQALGNNWSTLINQKVEEGGYILKPFVRALSTDLNFTAALALISVLMTQVIGVQAQGFRYFGKFLNFSTMFQETLIGFHGFYCWNS